VLIGLQSKAESQVVKVRNEVKLFKARITIRITQEMLEEIESIAKKRG
jgi:Ribbon-helix-helix protein, copG family.